MAAILGRITVNGKDILEVDADPAAGGGTVAPIGSLAMYDSGAIGVLYFKNGALDTDWTTVDLTEGNDWTLLGNALSGGGPTTPNEWFGSSNDYDVVYRRNNTEIMRLAGSSLLVGLAASIGGRLQVGHVTADADMVAQIFGAANRIIHVTRMSRLTTVDAAAATQDFNVPSDYNALFEAKACARQTAGATGAVGDGASYVRTCHARNVGGTVAIFGSQTDYTYEVAGGLNFTLSANAGNVRATADGVAGRTITWGLYASLLLTNT